MLDPKDGTGDGYDDPPKKRGQCCCQWGAAVGNRGRGPSDEWPEFDCADCPIHGDDTHDHRCRRHLLAHRRFRAQGLPSPIQWKTAERAEEKGVSTSRRRRKIERIIKMHSEELEQLERFPDLSEFPSGTVLIVTVMFEHTSTTSVKYNKTYVYALVKGSNHWFGTGRMGVHSSTDDQTLEWLTEMNVIGIFKVTDVVGVFDKLDGVELLWHADGIVQLKRARPEKPEGLRLQPVEKREHAVSHEDHGARPVVRHPDGTVQTLGQFVDGTPGYDTAEEAIAAEDPKDLSEHDIAPGLWTMLRMMADEWGALGVAQSAAAMTDPAVLVDKLGGVMVRPGDEVVRGGTEHVVQRALHDERKRIADRFRRFGFSGLSDQLSDEQREYFAHWLEQGAP